jgi:phage shock protein PspC (stress-responsive transcriptional regulator)
MVRMTDQPTEPSSEPSPPPEDSRGSADPAGPVGPADPGGSADPGAPSGPVGPAGPGGSAGPSAPSGPGGPGRLGSSAGPGRPDGAASAGSGSGAHRADPGDAGGSGDAGGAGGPGRSDAPGGEGPDTPERPKLARGRDDQKVLAGVCAGAGRFFDVDPVIFRIVLVLLSLTGGIGLIIYGMGWLVIPQQGERQSEAHRLLSGRVEGAPLTAVLMTLVGCGLYASMIGNGANQAFSLLLLAATAGAVYWSQQRRRLERLGEQVSPTAAGAVADAPPAVQAPPEPVDSPSWWREPLTKESGYLWGPDDDAPDGKQDKAIWRERKKAARRNRGSRWFGFSVWLLAAIAAGVGVGVSAPYQPYGTAVEIGLASALGVYAFAFLLASFVGRPRFGMTVWSVLITAGLVTTAAAPDDGHGIVWRPTTTAAVRPVYDHTSGIGTLDLRQLALDGHTVTTRVKFGAGRIVIRLPKNATVHLDYNLSVGEVVLPGRTNDGVDIETSQHQQLTYPAGPGAKSTGTIDLHVKLSVGQLKVIR